MADMEKYINIEMDNRSRTAPDAKNLDNLVAVNRQIADRLSGRSAKRHLCMIHTYHVLLLIMLCLMCISLFMLYIKASELIDKVMDDIGDFEDYIGDIEDQFD